MHKKTVYKSTYNSCKDGNDASQTGISPVRLLFCNFLHTWKANLMIMHELNEFATCNEMAKLEQNQGDQSPIFRRWLSYKQVLFVEINGDQALDPFNMSIEKLCSFGQLVVTTVKIST